jgi:tryptophan synthase alpha chain
MSDSNSPLAERFARLRAKGEKALVLFVTAGDPPLEEPPAILETLAEAGADVIEVGMPFSDPIADGPTIQASSQRALDCGATPSKVLEALGAVQLDVPRVLMGYYNPVLRRGLDAFAAAAAAAGVSGTIISDLTPEEAQPWRDASLTHGLDTIFLVAPTSTEARLEMACSMATGFVYAVSRTGVTGAGNQVPADVGSLVRRVRAHTETPVCVGFGISTPEHVRAVCADADGAVVGSWLVDLLAQHWQGGAGREKVRSAVAELKAATR